MMNPQRKMAYGAALAVLGGLATAIGPTLGLATLARPWSFIAGFLVGLLAGLGAALAIVGMLERRHRR
jgi:hypothetical protein